MSFDKTFRNQQVSFCCNFINNAVTATWQNTNLAFIVNVVLNGNHEIIGSFAGDMETAHEKGCDFVRSLASVNHIFVN